MTVTKTAGKKAKTVMLAADVGSVSITTVNLAVAIAASANSPLQGLFVEDEDLLQVSGLPCSREITLTTARERPTSLDQMQRSLRAVARQFRQALEREAQAGHVGWSFDTVRGRMRDVGLMPERIPAYTVLGRPLARRLSQERVPGVQKVLLLGKRSARLMHLVELLIRRAVGEKIEFTLVANSGTAELAEAVEKLASISQNRVSIVEVGRAQLLEQLAVWQGTFDLAIITRRDNPGDLSALLQDLRCPAVLVA